MRDTGLDWTLVRPTRLTLAPGTGSWRAEPGLRTSSLASIPRADLARFLVQILADPTTPRATLSVTGAPKVS